MVDVIGRAVIKVEGLLDQQSLSAVGNGFRKALVPAIAALGALGVASVKAIHDASDLGEQVSKSGVIFGKQAKQIDAFASSAAKSLFLSKRAALDASSTFGITAQSAGLSGQAAVDFAKKFTTLSADLASFSNTSPEEAITAVGAALRGESEPIRKYGVLLDDATLKARALKEGIIQQISGALTPQQRALAASAEIFAQTTKAQGDAARTAGSAANQEKRMKAEFENLSATLGTKLLPIYIQLETVALKALDWMSKHQTTVAVLAGIMGGLALAIVAVNVAMALLAANPIAITIGAIVLAAAALAGGFVLLWQKSETFRTAMIALGEGIQQIWETKIKPALDRLRDKWDEIKPKVQGFIDKIGEVTQTAVPALLRKLNAVVDFLTVDFPKAWNFSEPAITKFISAMGSVAGALDSVLKVIEKIDKHSDGLASKLLLGLGTGGLGFGLGFSAQGQRNWPGGLSVVGERGPEIVNLPRGSDVFTNQESRRMVGEGAGSSVTINNVNYGPVIGSQQRLMTDWSAKYASRWGAVTA